VLQNAALKEFHQALASARGVWRLAFALESIFFKQSAHREFLSFTESGGLRRAHAVVPGPHRPPLR